MRECRYYGVCYNSDPVGGSKCVIGCKDYEPMPDIDALEALARDMESAAGSFGSYDGFSFNRSSPDLAYLAGSVAETYRHVAGIIRRSIGDGNGHE